EDLSGIESSVAVSVLEDEDPVAGLTIGDATRIVIGLGDPDPAATVDRHRDGLDDVRLAGKQRDAEPGRDGHRPRGLIGIEPGVLVYIASREPSPRRDGGPRVV